jgi:hypothetical protein
LFDSLLFLPPSSPETIASPTLSFPSPKRLQILSEIILPNPELSLYTLNAPQNAAKGTTALALAAWLNKPEDVRALLDVKPGLVAVDCRDGLDATPLMCESPFVRASKSESPDPRI